MKNGGIRKMKYIMKTISVWLEYIVSQRITNENTVPLYIALPTFSLSDFYFKMLWQSFLFVKCLIKCR